MTTVQSYNLGYSEGYHLRFVLQIPKGLNDEAYSRGYAMGGKVRKAYKLLPPELQKCRCCNQDKGATMRLAVSAGYATCVEAMADGEDKIKELESEG